MVMVMQCSSEHEPVNAKQASLNLTGYALRYRCSCCTQYPMRIAFRDRNTRMDKLKKQKKPTKKFWFE
jgi:hypothetical protein